MAELSTAEDEASAGEPANSQVSDCKRGGDKEYFDIPPWEATAEEVTATRVWEVAAVAPLALVAPALLEDAAAALEDEAAALELAAAEALLPVAVAATTVVPVVEVEVEVAEAEVEDEDEEEEALQVKSKRGVVLPVVTPKLGLAPLSFKVYQ